MKRVLLLMWLSGMVAGVPPAALPHEGSGPGAPIVLARDADAITLDQAVERVRRLTGGRVLDAYVKEEDGHRVYVIKVLTPGGHVRIFEVDARTGRIGH